MIETVGKNYKTNWRTPVVVQQMVKDIFGGSIDLDPCADQDKQYWFASLNATYQGLQIPWTGNVFINPPYGRSMPAWVTYGLSQTSKAQIWLVAARLDTQWWSTLVTTGITFAVKKGRLRFDDGKVPAQFPSALIYRGEAPLPFRQFVQAKGWTCYLSI